MLETQNFESENYLPPVVPADKKDDGELRIFNAAEWEYFIDEVNKQVAEGVPVDFNKATDNARYLAEIASRIKNIDNGKWTEHELIEVDGNE